MTNDSFMSDLTQYQSWWNVPLLFPAYICALQKEVPYHGRLYITNSNACFHSSVLLKDTKVGGQSVTGFKLR